MSALVSVYERLPVLATRSGISSFGLHRYWDRSGHGYQSALSGYLSREMKAPDQMRNVVARRARGTPEIAAYLNG